MRRSGFLEVRVGDRRFGLPVEHVVEVADMGDVLDVPRRAPALRGLTAQRGRLVPLVHLGALMDGGGAPETRGRTIVVARVGADPVAFEVDDAEHVWRDAVTAAPAGKDLPWARGIARLADGLVPILDLAALGERLTGTSAEDA